MFRHRQYPRLSKNCQIIYRLLDKEQFADNPISSLALNISGGGLCFETTEPLQKGDLVALSIHAEDVRPILALGKVVWCKATRESYNVGAEFWWIGWHDQGAQQTIADYVADQTLCATSACVQDARPAVQRPCNRPGRYYCPWKTGERFSKKALRPS